MFRGVLSIFQGGAEKFWGCWEMFKGVQNPLHPPPWIQPCVQYLLTRNSYYKTLTLSFIIITHILEVGCMELFFQFVLATTFFDAFYDTGNSKKRIIKKYEKFRWCTQFSFGDFKIRHFSQIVIILVCKEHKFLIFLSQYMLKYVLNMSLDCCWHYKVIWLCSGGSL